MTFSIRRKLIKDEIVLYGQMIPPHSEGCAASPVRGTEKIQFLEIKIWARSL